MVEAEVLIGEKAEVVAVDLHSQHLLYLEECNILFGLEAVEDTGKEEDLAAVEQEEMQDLTLHGVPEAVEQVHSLQLMVRHV